uniref:Mitochondrial rRNA methyltransferase 1 homolog (S. cerevisiae) n=1 Tax=Cyprinus carpio TaxID=7962 RepID=A0A8C1LXD8_CYPCA
LSSINMLHIQKEFEPNEDKHLEIVFGVAPCLLALMQRTKPSHFFMKNGEGPQRDVVLRVCQEAVKRGVQIQRVSIKHLIRCVVVRSTRGCDLQASPLGFITEEKPTSHEVKNHRALWLVLDGLQDPMNLGAILHISWDCPLTPTVSKASAGVMEVRYQILEEGWQVVGTVGLEECSPESTVMPCSDFKMSRPTLLLMGGEGDGLSPELRQMCDVQLTIPPRRNLHPEVESLNVSVATGMFI